MLRMCVYMHSYFVENHLIRIMKDGPLISETVLSHQVSTHTLIGSASFLILHIRRVKCEDPCTFFITPGRRCSASLRMRRRDPCSLNTVSRSRYGASPRGWWPGPYSFNIIPEFQYDASLRGLRPNDLPCGFIFIKMVKIVVGSSSLTQHLLIYPGLRPAMLDNIGGVVFHSALIDLELALMLWASIRTLMLL
jgi:hypothetical protein